MRTSRAKGRASLDVDGPHPVRGVRGKRIGRLRTDGRRGHSFSRAVFRKCTFGAINRRLTPATLRVAHAAWRGDGPAGAPDLSVAAGGALGVGPGGRAHHLHLCSLATYGLAHLCTDSGVRSAPARASSSPLSGAASIRFCPDRQTGHSSESTLFRKCTFGAIRASHSQAAHAA